MKTYRTFLIENFHEITKEPSTFAAKSAQKLGLEYYGFGRYGKDNKATHFVAGSDLKPIAQRPLDATRHEKIINHAKGLANNGKLTNMKTSNPEAYKKSVSIAQERVKLAQIRHKDRIHSSDTMDKVAVDYDKYFKDQQEVAEKTHASIKANYDWRGLSQDEKNTLRSYNAGDHKAINDALNGNPNFMYDKVNLTTDDGKGKQLPLKHAIDHLDNALLKTSASQDFFTYGGVAEFDPSKSKSGIFSHKGYRSTTLNPSTAIRFTKDENNPESPSHVIQFKIKKGDKGMYMDGHYTGAVAPGEREFLMPRNTHFKVSDKPKKIVDPNTGHVINIHQAEIVPDPDLYS